MTRLMYDCTGGNAVRLKSQFGTGHLIAFYGTGSPDVQWDASERTLFPASLMVEIDQGATDSPVASATVRDVESLAWNAQRAVSARPWTPARPTIYCSRDSLPDITAAGWKGDVWLAWPGFTGTAAPVYPGVTVVAVQDVFGGWYDSSVVFDPTWPLPRTGQPPSDTMSVTVYQREAHASWAPITGADHYVVQFLAAGSRTADTLEHIPAAGSGNIVHASPLTLPGATGGTLTVYAIVKGKPILVGTKSMPI